MNKPRRIGMIGLDTSHVPAFAKLLNDPRSDHHVPGGKVVVGYPGGSPDVETSISRVGGFAATLRDDFDVEMLDSPAAVADASDLVFIETIDGRIHKQLFEEIAPYGKPTFIDKPLTVDPADAKAILDLAEQSATPVMSCSAVRYGDNLQAALADDEKGPVAGCDAFGPMKVLPPFEGLYWYGIHSVEMVVAAMGPGCRRVRTATTDNHEVVIGEWDGDRVATIHGLRNQHNGFGITVHRQQGIQIADIAQNARPFYASLLEAIMRSLPEGRSDIPRGEMLDVIRIVDAANTSRRTGEPVELLADDALRTSQPTKEDADDDR